MKIKILSVVAMCLFLMVSLPAYTAPVMVSTTTTITNRVDVKISITLAKGVTIDDILIDLVGQGYVVSQNTPQGNVYVISFYGTKTELIDVLNYIGNNGGSILKIKIQK